MARILFLLLLACPALAHAQTHATRLVLIIPFTNNSKAPGLEWVSESFPEVMGQTLSRGRLFVVSRQARLNAFDRLGIPTGVQLSRATLLRIAQEMDVDFVVSGSFDYDRQGFTAHAQVMDINRLRLSRDAAESGAITQTVDIESALANAVTKEIERAGGPASITAPTPSIRLDALENYIKGITTGSVADQIRFLKEAVRLAPGNERALLALGRAYFDNKDFAEAVTWLRKVPATTSSADEANFFLGLADCYLGNLNEAEAAFKFTQRQLPLIEVDNNLGVVAARRGNDATARFQHAVSADDRDPDYHFNYGLSLYRAGDLASAAREMKAVLSLAPQDAEARTLLSAINTGGLRSGKLPSERLKRNYDEPTYRQLALEIQNVNEVRYSTMPAPEHARAHVAHGNELLAQGLLDFAETEFREAIILDPTSALAHAGLAQVLERRNDLPAARAEASAANQLAPSTQALLVLARIEKRQQHPEAAKDWAQQALRIEPGNSEAQDIVNGLSAAPAQP